MKRFLWVLVPLAYFLWPAVSFMLAFSQERPEPQVQVVSFMLTENEPAAQVSFRTTQDGDGDDVYQTRWIGTSLAGGGLALDRSQVDVWKTSFGDGHQTVAFELQDMSLAPVMVELEVRVGAESFGQSPDFVSDALFDKQGYLEPGLEMTSVPSGTSSLPVVWSSGSRLIPRTGPLADEVLSEDLRAEEVRVRVSSPDTTLWLSSMVLDSDLGDPVWPIGGVATDDEVIELLPGGAVPIRPPETCAANGCSFSLWVVAVQNQALQLHAADPVEILVVERQFQSITVERTVDYPYLSHASRMPVQLVLPSASTPFEMVSEFFQVTVDAPLESVAQRSPSDQVILDVTSGAESPQAGMVQLPRQMAQLDSRELLYQTGPGVSREHDTRTFIVTYWHLRPEQFTAQDIQIVAGTAVANVPFGGDGTLELITDSVDNPAGWVIQGGSKLPVDAFCRAGLEAGGLSVTVMSPEEVSAIVNKGSTTTQCDQLLRRIGVG